MQLIAVVQNLGVRARLMTLTLLAVAPLAALLFVGVLAERRVALNHGGEEVRQLAQLAAERQARTFDEARTLLSVLRLSVSVGAEFSDECRTRMRETIAAHPQFMTLGVADADGQIVCHNLLKERRAFGDKALVEAVQAPGAGEFQIGRFLIGTVTGKPTIVGALRMPAADGRSGFLFASLNLAAMSAIAEAQSGGARSAVVIEPDSGVVMAQSGLNPRLVGRGYQDATVLEAMRTNPFGGLTESVGPDGTPQIVGFAPLPRTSASGTMVAVGMARQAVLATADQRSILSLALGAAATAAALGLAWWFGHLTQIRPIRQLASAAEAIGAGALGTQVAIGPWQAPELRFLGGTLNAMAERLGSAHAAVQDSEQRYRLLAESATDMVFRLDRDHVRRYVSPASREILGREPEAFVGLTALDRVHPEDVEEASRTYAEVMAGLDRADAVYRVRHENGRWIWVEVELRALKDERGAVIGLLGALRDVSQRKKIEETLATSEARFRLLAENTADLVTRIGPDGRRLFASPACRELLGYEPEELIGASPLEIVHPDDTGPVEAMIDLLQSGKSAPSVQYRARRSDGGYVWVETSGRSLGSGLGVVFAVRDISRRKLAEDQLAAANRRLALLATLDGLTGLANRRCFDETIAREFARASREAQPLSLLLADVDSFKAYNDAHGHPAGDEVLKTVSRVLENSAGRPGDLAARYGGEEFALILPATGSAGAQHVADGFRAAVEALAIPHRGSTFGIVTVSVGVVSAQPVRHDGRPAGVLRQADEALYAAKAAGRNRVRTGGDVQAGLATRPGAS